MGGSTVLLFPVTNGKVVHFVVKSSQFYSTHTNVNFYRDDYNFFYNWVTHISIKDTLHTVERKNKK